MKTLKQFLEDEGYTLTGSIRSAVREWLEQHYEQPLVENSKATNNLRLNFTAGQLAMIRELKEDL